MHTARTVWACLLSLGLAACANEPAAKEPGATSTTAAPRVTQDSATPPKAPDATDPGAISTSEVKQSPTNHDAPVSPTTNSDTKDPQPTATGPLCPGCRPDPGGQTSDFDSPACPTEEHPITDEQKRAFGVDEIVAATSEPFALGFEWRKPVTEGGARPAVLSETTIDIAIELGEFSYFGPKPGVMCGDGVQAPVMVTFSTRDGAVAAQAHGFLGRSRNSETWLLESGANLMDATGNLDLGLDPDRVALGSLGLDISGMASGLRGHLQLSVLYFDSEEQLAKAPMLWAMHQSAGETLAARAEGTFPADGCWIDSFPIDAHSSHSWLGGRSPADMFELARSTYGASSTFDAQWGDGTKTRVTIDLGEPPDGSVCMRDVHNDDVSFEFAASARLRTEDGRVDALLPQGTLISAPLTGELASVGFVADTPRMAPADFVQAAGIHGLDTTGTATFRSYLTAWRSSDPEYPSNGQLGVDAGSQSLCLMWPVGPIDAYCNPITP